MRKLNKSELKRVYGAGWAKGGGHDQGLKVGDTLELDHDVPELEADSAYDRDDDPNVT